MAAFKAQRPRDWAFSKIPTRKNQWLPFGAGKPFLPQLPKARLSSRTTVVVVCRAWVGWKITEQYRIISAPRLIRIHIFRIFPLVYLLTSLICIVQGIFFNLYTMGIIRRSLRLAEYSGYAAIVAFVWKTRNAKFVDMPISDHIFHSSYFHKLNPERNPTTHDLYIQKVPLSDINPALLNTKGKLVEAFCAGVWSGSGMTRAIAV